MKDILAEVKNLLDNNKEVLFSGTPCQIAGLKNYLKKDYCNLFTVDILCHGAPSAKVWMKYAEKISNGKIITSVNFRDKKQGSSPFLNITFSDKTEYQKSAFEDLYFRAFLENITLNNCCYDCNYADIKRMGDISLGDFWGIKKYNRKIDDKKGVSLALINTKKGKEIFEIIKKGLFVEKVPEIYATDGNPVLKTPCNKHSNRKTFFEKLDKTDIIANLKTSVLNKQYDGIILNFWYSNSNYGAILTAYAIQQFFMETGHSFYLLNYNPEASKRKLFAANFQNKYLKLTHPVFDDNDFKNLNACTNTFVTGSDQVFRYTCTNKDTDKYLLAFSDFSKKRIAFSASFGKDTYDEATFEQKYIVKKYLKRFDNISTRELSGVDILENEFDIKGSHIIDPVFLADKKIWNAFDNEAVSNKYKNKLVSYILDSNNEINKACDYISKKYGVSHEKISYKEIEVEEFVCAIKNAQYFITDSFHGVCFALLFNKKVICLMNESRGQDRFNSLIKLFNINSIFIKNIEDIYTKTDLFASYNIENFENIIKEQRKRAKIFIENALNKTKTNDDIINELDFLNSPKIVYKTEKKKYSPFEYIFSFKNEFSNSKQYKVLTILGVKMKFRKK